MSNFFIRRPIVADGHRHPHGDCRRRHYRESACGAVPEHRSTGKLVAGQLCRGGRAGTGAIRRHAIEQQITAWTT